MCLTESLIYFNFSETFNKTHILSKLNSKFFLCVILSTLIWKQLHFFSYRVTRLQKNGIDRIHHKDQTNYFRKIFTCKV